MKTPYSLRTILLASLLLAALALAGYFLVVRPGNRALAIPEGSAARETVLTLANDIAATVHRPAGDGPFPAVILLHGFGSSRDEVGKYYASLAGMLGSAGIGSLRIDFRGFGESPGDPGATTIDAQVADVLTAHDWLVQQSWVDPDRIGVQGFSLGGAIAIIVAAEHPEWAKSLVTWSTMSDFDTDFARAYYDDPRGLAETQGHITIETGGRTIALQDDFFATFDDYDLMALAAGYPGAFLAIAGENDRMAPYPAQYMAMTVAEPARAWVVPHGNHTLGAAEGNVATMQSVVDATVQWFVETLGG